MSKLVISRQYISTDRQSAVFGNSEQGFEVFGVGETVAHQDESAGTAVIEGFEVHEAESEIIVKTDKGFARLPFLEKL